MEKAGLRRLGRLFRHRSESEDSEADSLPSPCPSPAPEPRREHRLSASSQASPPGARKKRSGFGPWRLRRKESKEPGEDHRVGGGSVPASPSYSPHPPFSASEPSTPTNRYFDMPDTKFAPQTNQLPLVSLKESQFAYAIPMVSIASSTLPASFRKSKNRTSESSKEENKKKPVLGKFGNFFTTGRRKKSQNTLELRPKIIGADSASPQKNLAPLASLDIDDIKDLSKSEESLIDQAYDQNQSRTPNSIDDRNEYLYNKDLTPLYNDIVSEWNTKGISSDSEWSSEWHSSNETIKDAVFSSNLSLQTLGAENELVTDTTYTTTPDFRKTLANTSSEDLEHSILDHKQLVDVHPFLGSDYAASNDQFSSLESKPSEHICPSRVLTLDIFLHKTEQPNSNKTETATLDKPCSKTYAMDKKTAARRSGKRRKSQSSSDVPNGDRNVAENSVKEEPGFGSISSDLTSEKINNSERKAKASPQNNYPTANHDTRTGSNQKGLNKTELDKSKQQTSASSPCKKKSLKKNQSEAGPLSPTGLKSQGKDSATKRQNEGVAGGNPTSKSTTSEKSSSSESSMVTYKMSPTEPTSTLPLSEEKIDSKVSHFPKSTDGSGLGQTDKCRNGEMGTTDEKSSDLGTVKQRNISFDVSRTVTTKVSLPAKPKRIELNLKTSKSLEDLGSDHDSVDKAVKINFNIANKISMFENKQSNHTQSTEGSKKGSVSNTFVGRAKLKFGKQHTENEQLNRAINKANSRQKTLQNGTKIKEIASDIKIKSEGRTQSNIITNEEVGKAAECQVNQTGNIDILTAKNLDVELMKENLQPTSETKSIEQRKEIANFQNNINVKVGSMSPEGEEEHSLKTDLSSTNKDEKSFLQSDLTARKSEFEQTLIPEDKTEDNNMTNTVLENIQMFEQNISGQQSPRGSCSVLKSGNEEPICESPSDMAKFTETLKNLDSAICIPQKKKKAKVPKSPAPHFAMPPIHEDNLEKIFDPNVFTVGLGMKRDKPQDLAPSLQLKLQSLETEVRVRPKRASAENSIILQCLKSNRADPVLFPETNGKESKDSTDGEVKRSRLENSAIFSSLLSPSTKEKVFVPSVTSINTITTSFASQKTADSLGIPPVMFDTAQRPESFSDFKATNYIDKYLQTDDAKNQRILQMPNFGNLDTGFSSWMKPGQYEPNSFLDIEQAFSGNSQNKINPRPGKIVIVNKPGPSESTIEVFNDVLDCTSWVFSPVIFVKIIRGCWILYEKPNFEGPSIPLEEGELEFTNLWGEEPYDDKDGRTTHEPAVIGSIRHVIKDYRLCRIDLFTEPDGLGLVNSYFDDTEETRFGSPQKTSSIRVHWGIWLLYEEPGFLGIPLMLEPGEYPNLSFWERKDAYIRSLRPLKMGGRKVEYPASPKIIIYEKPFFEGKHIEHDSKLIALTEEGKQKDESAVLGKGLTSIGSIKVKEGVWVAYEKPEFTGHQYLLEEGEYKEWMDWGGYNEQVQSLRPILGSFSQPHMIMYSEKDFGTKGSSIDVLGIIANLKDTGYGLRTQSINVLSGVWVAYENPDFTGEQFILEKGLYSSYEAWGAKDFKISSVQPITSDISSEHTGKFKVQVFSEPEFQGNNQIFEKDISQIEKSFPVMSSKVLSGSWIAYDQKDFSGNQYVLEEGAYPDLSAMGCLPQTCLKSLQVVNIELSEPMIALYEKKNFKGRKIEFTTEVVNLRFLGYNPDIASLEVHGGIWIIYEHNNYKGRQILLAPSKIPNWDESSSYQKVGSLRPLLQKRVYFTLRNRGNGKFMSTDGNLNDLNLLRIQGVDDTKTDEQIWMYQDGFIKCRVAEDFCLTIVGNLITPGAKLGLALQQNEDKQKWSINPDGKIYSKMKPHLVLDIKGGKHYDQNHLIVSSTSEDRPTQYWEPLVI
nr:beta/gamma crystallin domain-containing protein 1 isoform X1 [Anolis sagrei ordinatus]